MFLRGHSIGRIAICVQCTGNVYADVKKTLKVVLQERNIHEPVIVHGMPNRKTLNGEAKITSVTCQSSARCPSRGTH
jgi:hypothetical protein